MEWNHGMEVMDFHSMIPLIDDDDDSILSLIDIYYFITIVKCVNIFFYLWQMLVMMM